jgi:rhamnulokinase
MINYYLAIDLGADSGRLILGALEDKRLTLEEIHRFSNTPIKSGSSMYWNIDSLWTEIRAGLKKAAARKIAISSVSCDSWGVDYLLFDGADNLIQPTFHYRDPRTLKGVETIKEKVTWEAIFAETGIQFMPLNTLYQLAAETPDRFSRARRLLCVGDAINYLLSGVAMMEESLASTTQVYNPRSKDWSNLLVKALGVPERLMPQVVPSGTKLGPLRPEITQETGLGDLEVIATCSHDTGAAVAAVPAAENNWAYLSSGTWSLMGVEKASPVISDECRNLNFTNEIGFGGSIRLLKNISGLWLVQESRREWAKAGQPYDFAALEKMAQEAAPFVSLINPADSRFLAPDRMPEKIADLCRETGQPAPATPGATIRCVYESLALLYRRTLHNLEKLTGTKMERLHVVGGGSKDAVLNQFAANAIQLPVVAGPVEATAAGNLLVQAIALGHLSSLAEAREVVRNSVSLRTFQPTDAPEWAKASQKFDELFPA